MEAVNPYDSPTSDLATTEGGHYTPRFWALDGRLGRLRYLAYSLAMGALGFALFIASVMALSMIISGGDIVMVVMGLVWLSAAAGQLVIAGRRLHDLGRSRWWLLLCLLPFINLLLLAYLIFAPGQPHANRFGPAPVANGVGVIVAACLVPMVAVLIGLLVVLAVQQYQTLERHSRNLPAAPRN
ncbi:hypothetical protein GCM10007907_23330 [Chitinimonas prasina]|uniref:DUF805 domain-containing protein n=1 Tax=Chitinimonas prasina TaxID=1434937 RepID=A0ABQ5YGD0_9NEIS|nr:DUF805 domain-containing protein [Chitinimonas prasina]GLR13543.1 hypothetical protein GCM10007907_23330 [Chitinimonas prasina]